MVLYRLSPVVADKWQGLDSCPDIGPLPACYLVGLCYAAMALAALAAPRRLFWLFIAGWVPVFLLALGGTTLELSGRPTCPPSPTGLPMCYFSLAIACLLLPAFLASLRFDRKTGAAHGAGTSSHTE